MGLNRREPGSIISSGVGCIEERVIIEMTVGG